MIAMIKIIIIITMEPLIMLIIMRRLDSRAAPMRGE